MRLRCLLLLASMLTTGACGAVASDGPDAAAADAGARDACVAESDEALCARLGKSCEGVESIDNCGAPRSADCGTCEAGEGCSYGACQAPACAGGLYDSLPFPGLSVALLQDDVLAASASGDTILSVRSQVGCGDPYDLFLTDRVSGGEYTTQTLAVEQLPAGLSLFWGSDTLSADGLTLMGKTTDGKTFVSTTRSALGASDFGAVSTVHFQHINDSVAGNASTLSGPALSSDGLELFYSLYDGTSTQLLRSRRPDTQTAFPVGTPLPASAQGFEYVSGVSPDGLSIFLTASFRSFVLTRATTSSDAFVNPNAPAEPPTVPGWHVIPYEDCAHLVGIVSPGGCANEDVYRFDRP